MTFLAKIRAAIAAWRLVSGWLDKPWVKSILGFLAGLFKSDPNAPKVYRRDDPDKPRDATEDLKSENQPNV